jgi:hypothetical protein
VVAHRENGYTHTPGGNAAIKGMVFFAINEEEVVET